MRKRRTNNDREKSFYAAKSRVGLYLTCGTDVVQGTDHIDYALPCTGR